MGSKYKDENLANQFAKLMENSRWIKCQHDNKQLTERNKALERQVEKLRQYIVNLHLVMSVYKTGTLNDLDKLEYPDDLEHILMSFPTSILKQALDKLYEDDHYDFEPIIDALHLELNMRGEGDYVAV